MNEILSNLGEYIQDIQKNTKQETEEENWKFVQDFISEQRKDQTSDDSNQDLQDVVAISTFSTSLDVVMVWGVCERIISSICPRKKKGNLVSVDVLLNQQQISSRKSVNLPGSLKLLTDKQKIRRLQSEKLFFCLNSLFEQIQKNEFKKTIIFNNYIEDMVPALVQLAHFPYPKPKSDDLRTKSLGLKDSPTSLMNLFKNTSNSETNDDELFGLEKNKRELCRKALLKLLDDAPEITLIRAMLHLFFSCCESSKSSNENLNVQEMFIPSPKMKWLFENVRKYLFRIFAFRKQGVSCFFFSLLETVPAGNTREVSYVVNFAHFLISQAIGEEKKEVLKSIFQQLSLLIHSKPTRSQIENVPTAVFLFLKTLIIKFPEEAKDQFFSPLLKPIIQIRDFCLKKTQENLENDEVLIENLEKPTKKHQKKLKINDKDIIISIESLHKVLFTFQFTNQSFVSQDGDSLDDFLVSIIFNYNIFILLNLYSFLSKTSLHVKSALEEILVFFFKKNSKNSKKSQQNIDIISEFLNFKKSDSNFNKILFSQDYVSISDEDLPFEDFEWNLKCFINFLKVLKHETLAGDIFVFLISELKSLKQELEIRAESLQTSKTSNFLGTEEDIQERAYSETFSNSRIFILHAISDMVSELGISIIRNTAQIIDFIKWILLTTKNYKEDVHISEEDVDEEKDDLETISMGLGLLTALLCGGTVSFGQVDEEKKNSILEILEMRVKLDEIAEILKILMKKCEKDSQIEEMASSCLLAIESRQFELFFKRKDSKSDLKIDEQEITMKIELNEILKELQNPLLPLRTYAIVKFRKFILNSESSRRQFIESRVKEIFAVLASQISSTDDTYLFIPAIQSLVSLVDVSPSNSIPILCEEYLNPKRSIENRLKLGEALMKAAERLGATLPQYAQYFVNAFLITISRFVSISEIKDEKIDEDFEEDPKFYVKSEADQPISMKDALRTSALSNLSTILETLKYGALKYLTEVLYSVEKIVFASDIAASRDKSLPVRLSSVHVLAGIVKIFKEDLQPVLEGENLFQSFQSLVERIKNSDQNELVRQNCEIILDEIEHFSQMRLFPKEVQEEYENYFVE